jgi:hypothetical protein
MRGKSILPWTKVSDWTPDVNDQVLVAYMLGDEQIITVATLVEYKDPASESTLKRWSDGHCQTIDPLYWCPIPFWPDVGQDHRFIKRIGTPTTVGELRSMISEFPDTMPLGFRNAPLHTLFYMPIQPELGLFFDEATEEEKFMDHFKRWVQETFPMYQHFFNKHKKSEQ